MFFQISGLKIYFEQIIDIRLRFSMANLIITHLRLKNHSKKIFSFNYILIEFVKANLSL